MVDRFSGQGHSTSWISQPSLAARMSLNFRTSATSPQPSSLEHEHPNLPRQDRTIKRPEFARSVFFGRAVDLAMGISVTFAMEQCAELALTLPTMPVTLVSMSVKNSGKSSIFKLSMTGPAP